MNPISLDAGMNAFLPKRCATLLLSALLLAACATPQAPTQEKPRLIVFMAVDGLPQSQVVGYRDQLAPDGLRRFLDRGAWFSDARYGHAFTVTGAGHAVMLTGAYPHRTGVIGNDWRDRVTGEPEYCTGDTAHTYLGHKTKPLDGTSPKNLLVETVGDVLKRTDARAKVIAISGKDRGSILPAGKTGVAYMYMDASGQFASSTYYMKEHPAWVANFHAAKPADRHFKATWSPLLPDAAYAKSLPDSQPWYNPGGKLPKVLGENDEKPGPAYYAALIRSPYGDALTLDFARAAIAGEALGQDDVPDILSVSLSTHDYVNHAYGPESRLSHDHVLHLDRLLEAFFRDLDRTIGKDRYIAVLTADHGFMPAPEYAKSIGRNAGRQNVPQLLANVNAALAQKFGEQKLARGYSASGVLLDNARIAQKQLDPAAVQNEVRRVVLAEPGVAAAFTRVELENPSSLPATTPFLAQVRKTWNRERSADVQMVIREYWLFESRRAFAATHGSPYAPDYTVPILFYGPRWVTAGRVDQTVEVADIAPTLARLLAVPAPAASEGKPLPIAPGR
jgi:predicted AlkP superfamily pyrophosphatase or phosphodiesterase